LAAGNAIVSEAIGGQVAAVAQEALAEVVADATSGIGEATAQQVVAADGTLQTSVTVANQLFGVRNFIPVQAILATIATGVRTADPQGVANQFMYTAEVVFNGSERILDVLVNEETGIITHVLYK
jgi:hypothetical protein